MTTLMSLYLLVLGVLSTRTSVTSQWSPLGGGFGLSLEMAGMVMPSSFSSSVEKHSQNLKAPIHECSFILNVEQRYALVLYPSYLERSPNGLYDCHIVVFLIYYICLPPISLQGNSCGLQHQDIHIYLIY